MKKPLSRFLRRMAVSKGPVSDRPTSSSLTLRFGEQVWDAVERVPTIPEEAFFAMRGE